VTDSNIVLHIDFPHLLWPGHDEEKINENLRGISGGPVFRVIESIDPDTMKVRKVNFELVGIIYEYIAMVDTVRAPHRPGPRRWDAPSAGMRRSRPTDALSGGRCRLTRG
jgi:hypothetical protein